MITYSDLSISVNADNPTEKYFEIVLNFKNMSL